MLAKLLLHGEKKNIQNNNRKQTMGLSQTEVSQFKKRREPYQSSKVTSGAM